MPQKEIWKNKTDTCCKNKVSVQEEDMLDIKFVRENPEIVKQNIRNKFQDSKLELVDKVLELDKENREIKFDV